MVRPIFGNYPVVKVREILEEGNVVWKDGAIQEGGEERKLFQELKAADTDQQNGISREELLAYRNWQVEVYAAHLAPLADPEEDVKEATHALMAIRALGKLGGEKSLFSIKGSTISTAGKRKKLLLR